MAENTQVAEKKEFTTALSRWSNEITGLIAKDYEACGVIFDEYSRKCAMEAVGSIYNLVKNDGKANMNSLDTSNLRGIVENCAGLKLNPSAYPRECYFQLRNVKRGNECVKEGDTYIPPKHKGLELTPPEWEENGLSDKAVRVVYPVKLTDGTVTYLAADRASVKVNLLAHVKQNMMNATFGICEDRYKATPKQKEEIKAKKDEILNALRACSTVDDMLDCEIAKQFISGAWLDTPESMIQRKMCNNATRKYPKNYDQMARQAQIELDDAYRQTQGDVVESANSVDFDEENIIDGEIVQEV